MTQPNITPQGFRTAAYLETKARMDAARSRTGKTSRRVTCTPPNVKCGGRCIPPNWDCRLKGKGPDPHLRAVKTDPLGGLANIQRGASRIAKGVARGNISEVEGGKRAIIRGVVKATPGDIQRKKELTKRLEDRTRVIGLGLLGVTVGLGAHSLLMKRNTFGYRDGVGANINDAVRIGISKVLDATPVLRSNRARARALAQGGVAAELERQRNPYTAQLTEQLAKTKFTATDTDGNSNLSRAVAAIDKDIAFKSPTASFNDWDKAHQSAFWSTKRDGKSVFAEPATNEFLARQFKLKGDDALTTGSIKDAMELQLKKYKEDLVELAAVQGYQVKTSGTSRYIVAEDKRRFIKGLVTSTLPKGAANDKVRASLTQSLEDTLNQSPLTRVKSIYGNTLAGFDLFYSQKASVIETAKVEPTISSAMRKSGSAQVLPDARIARAAFVTGKQVKGTAHAELLLREHFFQKVKGTPRTMFPVTDRLAGAAATEIEGRAVTPTEAFRILEREGITGAVPTQRSSTRAVSRATSTSTPTGQVTRPARRRSTAQRIADLMMQKNPDGTPRYATREAAEAALKRMQRKDELQQARIDAYLAIREDLRGKPCGASHIPKAHTCTKGQGRTVEQQKKREAVPQDRELKQLQALEKEMDRESGAKKSLSGKKIATALAIGTVGAVAVAAANDAYQLSSGLGMGITPGLRTAVRPFMSAPFSKAGPQGVQEALGKYYDSKVKSEGWKPGDLVFNRTKNEPTAHFAIYMGKKNGVHSFAQMGADGLTAKSGGIAVTEAGPGANRKFTSGVIFERAPSGKQPKSKYTPAQIAARVDALKGKTLDYDTFNANCESWARMIVSGDTRSTQSARLSQVSKLAIRGVYKGLGEVVKWSPDYVPETVQGDRIHKVAKWLDKKNPRGNDSGYAAMVIRNKNLRKDSPESDAVGLVDPGSVIKPEMSDIEAISATKRWLMVLSGVIAKDPKS